MRAASQSAAQAVQVQSPAQEESMAGRKAPALFACIAKPDRSRRAMRLSLIAGALETPAAN